jgi:hypothetical protein
MLLWLFNEIKTQCPGDPAVTAEPRSTSLGNETIGIQGQLAVWLCSWSARLQSGLRNDSLVLLFGVLQRTGGEEGR